MNRYIYCLNNPLNRVDPTGKMSFHNVKTGVITRLTARGYTLILEDGTRITRDDLDRIDEEIDEALEKEGEERNKALFEALSHLCDLFGWEYTWDPGNRCTLGLRP